MAVYLCHSPVGARADRRQWSGIVHIRCVKAPVKAASDVQPTVFATFSVGVVGVLNWSVESVVRMSVNRSLVERRVVSRKCRISFSCDMPYSVVWATDHDARLRARKVFLAARSKGQPTDVGLCGYAGCAYTTGQLGPRSFPGASGAAIRGAARRVGGRIACVAGCWTRSIRGDG